jgi:fructose/tagatose bisphosphate aldolase
LPRTGLRFTKSFDPRIIIGFARDMMQEVVEDRIKIFGSKNKA